MLHGETPSLFVDDEDQATKLLFSDAGSATALELSAEGDAGHFCLHTDGSGHARVTIPYQRFYSQDSKRMRRLPVSASHHGPLSFALGGTWGHADVQLPMTVEQAMTIPGEGQGPSPA